MPGWLLVADQGKTMSEESVGKKLVPLSEASVHLGIPERTLRYRVAKGELAGERVGRAWFVELSEDRAASGKDCSQDLAGPVVNNQSGPKPVATGGRLPPVPLAGQLPGPTNTGRFQAQSLKAWGVAQAVLGPVLNDLGSPVPLKRRLAEQAVLVFEELCRGYHAYHYRDKVGHYYGVRDALCSVAALAALVGQDSLSEAVQGEPLSSAVALIRSIEKKGRKQDGA